MLGVNVRRRLAVAGFALALGCGGGSYVSGIDDAPLEPLGVEPLPEMAAEGGSVAALEAQCRQRFSGESFQQAANALTEAQIAIGRLCTIELVGGSPLQWRVSCGSDDFFELGAHRLASATPCEVGGVRGRNGFECLGIALRSMLPHAEHIDVAAVGHVDASLPNARLGCVDLIADGWGQPPWGDRPNARGEEARRQANDRLAWCRAARAAGAIAEGIGQRDDEVRLVAVGASTSWMEPRYTPPDEEREIEGACPSPSNVDRDDPEAGRCAAARRVDVLIRMSARAVDDSTGAVCDRAADANQPAGALYCLEQCLASPERSSSSLGAATSFMRDGELRSPPGRWHVGTSEEGLDVNYETITRRLGY